jgi:pyruvate carboxylase subunit B
VKYYVTIAGRIIEVGVEGDRVTVEGREARAELRAVSGTPVRHLLVDGASGIIPMEPVEPGRWLVQRHGERFDVQVVDERSHHIRSLVGGGRSHAGPAVLKAPMPGLVARILVAPGQGVDRGTSLVVLEAMKMENELRADGPGVVSEIEVAVGQAVEKGQVLVTFAGPARDAIP